jgi:predicted amidohydrolase YtcJ
MCDLIFHNARVITLDPGQPEARVVGIKGNRIAAVADSVAIETLRMPGTRMIDCRGAALLPGFIDAHCHIHAYAETLVSLNLSPRESIHAISDIQDRIRNFAYGQPTGTWVRGKGYNEFYIAERRHPSRWDLDVAAPLHPVKLTHRSGHAHVLNSLALELVGISEETGDPPGGLIDRDLETGLPTGILYGMNEYLAAKIPVVDEIEIERGLALADKYLLSCGITSVHDASSVNGLHQWKYFESWKCRGQFHPRLTMMMGFNGFEEWQQNPYGNRTDFDLRLGGVKLIVNQVTGTIQPGREVLNEMVSAVHAAGLQTIIHAVEEPEIEAACNAIEDSLRRQHRQNHRHRIEHCSVCPPILMKRLAASGIGIVTQPSFIYFSGDRYLKTVSDAQQEHLYPIGSMLKNGIAVGFGSDFPISDPNPLTGVYSAVTRMTEANNIVLPQQGISVSDALRMYTMEAAAAGFEEEIKGSIVPGKLADLVLLNEDPRRINARDIKNIRVLMTMLDGRVVYENDAPSPSVFESIN